MGSLAGAYPVPSSRIKEGNEEIESFKQPAFICPYPLRRSTIWAKIGPQCRAWIEEQSLHTVFSDPKDWQFLMECKIYDLSTWVFVDSEEEELVWFGNLLMWFFILDDMLEQQKYLDSQREAASLFVELNLQFMWTFPDEPAIRDTFSQLVSQLPEEIQQPTLEYVDAKLAEARVQPGTVYGAEKIGPIGLSLRDLWVTYLRSTPENSAIRWALAMQRYLLGNANEAKNRNRQTIPSATDFVALRRNISGVEPSVVIVDYMDKVNASLPNEVFDSPEMKELLEAINDILSWHNDVWSFKKEVRKGELHNLVYITSRERGCSFSEAAAVVLEMIYRRLEDLTQAIADLEKITPPEHQQTISGYAKVAKFWVSGTHEFHNTNKRYDSMDILSGSHRLV